MITENKPAAPRHIDYLDSARGIAALMVMFYHFMNWRFSERTSVKIAAMVFNGSDAVSFFFVLSGFVLSYKYIVLGQRVDIRKFFITRLFRLWPAYMVIMILTALNTKWNGSSPDSYAEIFLQDKTRFWEEFFIFRGGDFYYNPGWTLVLELGISFFVPFWVFMAKKDVRIIYWLMLAQFALGAEIFVYHFLLGVLLSCFFQRLQEPSFRETKWYRYRVPLLLVSFVFFSIRHIFHIWPPAAGYEHFMSYLRLNPFIYTGFASFVFIAAIVAIPAAQRLLRNRVLLFMGKISYGIYLCHWAIVFDVFRNWEYLQSLFPNERTTFAVVVTCYAILSIICATILHYTVELPFMRLGKKLAARYKPLHILD